MSDTNDSQWTGQLTISGSLNGANVMRHSPETSTLTSAQEGHVDEVLKALTGQQFNILKLFRDKAIHGEVPTKQELDRALFKSGGRKAKHTRISSRSKALGRLKEKINTFYKNHPESASRMRIEIDTYPRQSGAEEYDNKQPYRLVFRHLEDADYNAWLAMWADSGDVEIVFQTGEAWYGKRGQPWQTGVGELLAYGSIVKLLTTLKRRYVPKPAYHYVSEAVSPRFLVLLGGPLGTDILERLIHQKKWDEAGYAGVFELVLKTPKSKRDRTTQPTVLIQARHPITKKLLKCPEKKKREPLRWSVEIRTMEPDGEHLDYCLISRWKTENGVRFLLSGCGTEGTAAAATIVTTEKAATELINAKGMGSWKAGNFEAVYEVTVSDMVPTKSRLLFAHSWTTVAGPLSTFEAKTVD